MVAVAGDEPVRTMLAALAPGTALRDGLERILRGNTGGLVVLGYTDEVASLCTGGFTLDVEFSASRLRELSKMDGAVVVSTDRARILRAAVHLVPDPSIPTDEQGTRHRTAERVARSINVPVIAVSQRMATIAVYVGPHKHAIEPVFRTVNQANQALQTLERYKARLDTESGSLSALEIDDLVTVRDVVTVIQRTEMVDRIAEEIEGHIVELGEDGRLVRLQLEELLGGVDLDRRMVVRDYLGDRARDHRDERTDVSLDLVLDELAHLSTEDLLDLSTIAAALRLPGDEGLDVTIAPHGFRLLSKLPRLPEPVIDRIVDHFGGLQKILRATISDLTEVEGVGEARAQAVKDGLSRLAETSILDRYG